MMLPFFTFYGGKWRLAERYGPPQHKHVIEPFAGSAGYSCFWEPPRVTLIECDPIVYGVWKFLQKVAPRELMRLPSDISGIDELPSSICQEARWLIGFWFNKSLKTPAIRRSNWARHPRYAAFYWSETIKLRLASQIERIRHWRIIEGSWEDAPDVKAHWHIDPPYHNLAGSRYRYTQIDRAKLARWCKRRRCFVQVCENVEATWLPFEPLSIVYGHRHGGSSLEAVCEIEN